MSRPHPWEKDCWLPGVLSGRQLKELISEKYIKDVNDKNKACGLSSFDLNLSDEGYRMKKGSIKPNSKTKYSEYLADKNLAERINSEDGIYKLDNDNKCYVFKLEESISAKLFNNNFHGQATPKSSIGRIDVIVRLIIDGMSKYDLLNPDEINKKTDGEMFVEIIPISFSVKVKKGISLTQLRLFYGELEEAEIKNKIFTSSLLKNYQSKNHLSVDLDNIKVGKSEEFDACAFKAIPNKDYYIKLWKEDKDIDYLKFWEPTPSDNNTLIIKNNDFYILRSKERILLPDSIAVYCRAMDETLGEMRIHYAGFVHPCFGKNRIDSKEGTPLIFEVRGHNVNVLLNDNEIFAKLQFYRMSESVTCEKPKKKNVEEDPYNDQELKLSSLFYL